MYLCIFYLCTTYFVITIAIVHLLGIMALLVVFVSDFQVFAFYYVLSSVIPTPWTHMVLDVLSC